MSPKSLEKAIAKMNTMSPEQLKKQHETVIKDLRTFTRLAPYLIILIITFAIVAPILAR